MKNNNLSNRILNMNFMKKTKEINDNENNLDNILSNKFDLKIDEIIDKEHLTNSKVFMEKPKALIEKFLKNSRSKIVKKDTNIQNQNNYEGDDNYQNHDMLDKKHNNHQYMKSRKGKK